MTDADLKARVRMDPSLNSTTVVSDADLRTLLNEGALDMNRRAKLLVGSDTWNTAASQQTYVLSGASPQIDGLGGFLDFYWEAGGLIYTQSSGVVKSCPNDFKIVSEWWLDLHRPGWQTVSASDTIQFAYLSHDSSGNLVLGQHPKPSSTTPQWKAYFVGRGTDMTATTHYPWTGSTTKLTHLEPFMKGCAFYAMWQLHELKTFQKEMAENYMKKYLDVVAQAEEANKKVLDAMLQGLRGEARVYAGQTFGY